MTKSTLTVKGKGLEKLKEVMTELASRPYVKVGVVGSAAAAGHGGLTNAELAVVHEFGTEDIPARPFLRSTASAQRAAWEALMRKVLEKVATRKLPLEKGLALIGERAAADVRRTVTSGVPPPNAPSTIAAKGSSKPLVDTGQLLRSIAYEVVPEGE